MLLSPLGRKNLKSRKAAAKKAAATKRAKQENSISRLKSKLVAESESRMKVAEESIAARDLIGYGPIKLLRQEGSGKITVSIEVNGDWYPVIEEFCEYPDHTIYPSGMVDEILRQIR